MTSNGLQQHVYSTIEGGGLWQENKCKFLYNLSEGGSECVCVLDAQI